MANEQDGVQLLALAQPRHRPHDRAPLRLKQGRITGMETMGDWQTVNDRFAIDLPYLWVDNTVTVWGATSTVQNWGAASVPATSSTVKSTVPILILASGVTSFSQIWLS